MKQQKVAIIGAGISGLYLAWKLSQKKHSVEVFEKEGKIGAKKICSGLFSQRILDFIPQSKCLIENEITSAFLYFPKKTIKIFFSKPFFVMNHSKLDELVFKLAKKEGAKINFNKEIKNIPSGFERIIGCDGANSIMRQKLGLKAPKFRLGILGFIKKRDYSGFVEIWPCENGFIWKIPRGEKIEYGIIAKPEKAKSIFNKFLKDNKIFLKNIQARLIPQGFSIPKNKKITLCGDATGLTKPWSGGGVVWALISANFLLKSFPDFLNYQKRIKKFFLPRIMFSKMATKTVYFLGFNLPRFLPQKSKIESDFLL